MGAHFERGMVLIEQGRYDLAEAELRLALAEDPDHAEAHALLSYCLAERGRLDEATDEARAAIGLDPELAHAHFTLAHTLRERNRHDEAASAILEAIRLEPENATYHGCLAGIRLAQGRWQEALHAADQGLACDPESTFCANLRAMALTKLGRRAEAGRTIRGALERDPEDDLSHATQGWALLHEGRPDPAIEHFKEALRLDPESELARSGLVEALKARYAIYGLMLKYFLWMGRLSSGARWGVLIGLFVGVRVLRQIGRLHPSILPFVMPIVIAYAAFAVMTWLADPLFNLVLRLNRVGRLALSRDQVVASNWVGLLLLCVAGGLGAWAATGISLWGVGALFAGVLIAPVAGIWQCERGWPRTVMALYTLALVGAAAGVAALSLSRPQGAPAPSFLTSLTILALLGAMFSPWVVNALASVQPKK